MATADEAGLVYVADAMPGIRRRRQGRGFSYRGPDGETVKDGTRKRITALAVPPAWSDVWICPDPKGHLQATGRDARGRKQYRYHDRWREVRDADKFSRIEDFGLSLDALRADVDADLGGRGRLQVVALVVRLLDETLIRVGNDEYAAANSSYGLTTLTPDHVELAPESFVLQFVGKGGIERDVEVDDRRLARLIRRCHELGGHELFSYRDREGGIASVSSSDVNDYLHDHAGPDVTAKVFRTWGASAHVVRRLAPESPPDDDRGQEQQILAAIDAAAELLGNTRAVCRQSYVHPQVLDAYRSGALLEAWRGSRSGARLTRSDHALLKALANPA